MYSAYLSKLRIWVRPITIKYGSPLPDHWDMFKGNRREIRNQAIRLRLRITLT